MIKETLHQIYYEKKYTIITAVTAVISFIIMYKLTLVKIAGNNLDVFIMMSGAGYTYFALFTLALISILFGIYLSIAIFKFNLIRNSRKNLEKNKKGFVANIFGYFGFFAGIFGAGCPTCGATIFALFGAPLALMYLPYKGAELRVLGVLILFLSNYLLIRSLNKCDLKIEEDEMKGGNKK